MFYKRKALHVHTHTHIYIYIAYGIRVYNRCLAIGQTVSKWYKNLQKMLIEHKMFPYPQKVLNILSQNNISNKNSKLFLISTDATESLSQLSIA